MDKEKIIEVLSSWNFWHRDIDIGIYREKYLEKMQSYLKTGQIVALTGIRRAGKSTLMKQFIKRQIKAGIDKNSFLYINFEEPKFAGMLSLAFLQQMYEAFLEIVQPKGVPYILLDEVQNVQEWERFVRGIHEKKEALVIVSGSTSKLSSPKLGTLLTGRWLEIAVYPLDFSEFLYFNKVSMKNKADLLSQKTKIKQLLREYLQFGGFPLIALHEEKEDTLRRYFDDIITKDVIERQRLRKVEKVRLLAKYYLTNFSAPISYRKIAAFIGLSLDSVERISSYMEDVTLIFFVPKFSYSLKEQEVNPRKIYCVDSGLINIVGFRFSENIGRLHENLVFLSLRQKKKEVYYYKNKRECDFVVRDGQKVSHVLQVCYNLSDDGIKKREIQGLLEACKELKCKHALIITDDFDGKEYIENINITYMPLWKWLLE